MLLRYFDYAQGMLWENNYDLKKQSQCQNGQDGTMSVIKRIYRDFSSFEQFLGAKNKPKQSQLYFTAENGGLAEQKEDLCK